MWKLILAGYIAPITTLLGMFLPLWLAGFGPGNQVGAYVGILLFCVTALLVLTFFMLRYP